MVMKSDTLDRQAAHANALLQDPLFRGACASLRDDAVRDLELIEMDGSQASVDKALETVRRLQALRSFVEAFHGVVRQQQLHSRVTDAAEGAARNGRRRP